MYKPLRIYQTNKTSKHMAYIVPTHLPVLSRLGLLDKNVLSAYLITEHVVCGKPNCRCATQHKLHKRKVIRWRDFEGERWVQHKKFIRQEDFDQVTKEIWYIAGLRYCYQHYDPSAALALTSAYSFNDIVATGIAAHQCKKLSDEAREDIRAFNRQYRTNYK